MTPERRFKRLERMVGKLATRGRVVRNEFRDRINILLDAQIQSEEVFREKINILIDAQIRSEDTFREKISILTDAQSRNEEAWLRHEEAWRAESHTINEQIKATDEQIKATDEQIRNVALAQIELTKSQKLTDRALRDFINSLHKGQNGR